MRPHPPHPPGSATAMHACDRQTDGRTDGQNYDSQDRTRICSRGKNQSHNKYSMQKHSISVLFYHHVGYETRLGISNIVEIVEMRRLLVKVLRSGHIGVDLTVTV